MTEFWEKAFTEKQLMWGVEPAQSAIVASDYFARMGAKDVLIPGVGYGRNAKAFLARGISVTGIEISETAIALARAQLALDIPIYHGSWRACRSTVGSTTVSSATGSFISWMPTGDRS